MLSVEQRAADAIEKAIIQRHYDPGELRGQLFMCIALTKMHRDGLVDTEAYLFAGEYIQDYIKGQGAMANYVSEYDVEFDHRDKFLWRIFCCNHFWKIIRKLRGEAPLEVSHVIS